MASGDDIYATDKGSEFDNEDKYEIEFEIICHVMFSNSIGFFLPYRKINSDQLHGVVSEYQGFIGDEAVKPRNKGRKKKFIWKLNGYSECTKSCGGGEFR